MPAVVSGLANDTYTVLHDYTLTEDAAHGVLSNDPGWASGPLTVSAVNGRPRRWAPPPPWLRRELTLNANGSLTYVPVAASAYDDSFLYSATDGTNSATATVTIHVTNQAPTATDDTFSILHDHTLTVTAGSGVLSNDTDADSDTLVVSGQRRRFGRGQHHHSGIGRPVDRGYRWALTYVPYSASAYDDSFLYTVTDGVVTATATATIHVTNTAPTASDTYVSTDENTPLTLAQGDLSLSDADSDPLTITDFTPATNGTVALVGANLVYTPNLYYYGSDSFTYTINDGAGGTATATVNITVNHVNQAPTPQPDTADVPLDTATTIDVLANDSDPDGDTLSIDSTTNGSHGTVTVSSNQAIYTPDTGYTGPDTFTYTGQ